MPMMCFEPSKFSRTYCSVTPFLVSGVAAGFVTEASGVFTVSSFTLSGSTTMGGGATVRRVVVLTVVLRVVLVVRAVVTGAIIRSVVVTAAVVASVCSAVCVVVTAACAARTRRRDTEMTVTTDAAPIATAAKTAVIATL